MIESVRAGIRFFRERRGLILLSVTAGWLLLRGSRLVYPVVVPYFVEEFEITFTIAGFLLTVLSLSYALGQFPGGLLIDRFGERKMLLASIAISALALLGIVLSREITALFALTVVLGLSVAAYSIVRFTVISELYSGKRGAAIGVTLAGGDLGNAVLPPIAGALAAVVAWRASFGFLFPFFVVVIAALYSLYPREESVSGEESETTYPSPSVIVNAVSQPRVVVVLCVQVLVVFVTTGINTFFPVYLVQVKEVSAPVASAIFGTFFAAGVVFKPLSGMVSDRIGTKVTLSLALLVSLFSFGGFVLASALPFVVVLTVTLGSIRGVGTLTMSFFTRELPDDVEGTSLGLLRTLYQAIGSLSPLTMGVLADRGYLAESFAVFAALLVLALLVTLLAFDPTGEPDAD